MSEIHTVVIEDHYIEDGVIDLEQHTKDNRFLGVPTEVWWTVNTVREGGATKGRRYKTLSAARGRFEAIVAAHTPPEGYEPPETPAVTNPKGWGRF